MKSLLLIPVLIMLLAFTCSAQKRIAAKEAGKHSGQSVMICDKVYNTEPVSGSNSTLLYLGAENGQYLTVLVKGSENPKFKWHPEKDFKGRNVCVTGKVVEFKGKPAIYVTDANQIKLDLVDNIVKPKMKL